MSSLIWQKDNSLAMSELTMGVSTRGFSPLLPSSSVENNHLSLLKLTWHNLPEGEHITVWLFWELGTTETLPIFVSQSQCYMSSYFHILDRDGTLLVKSSQQKINNCIRNIGFITLLYNTQLYNVVIKLSVYSVCIIIRKGVFPNTVPSLNPKC